MEEKLFMKDVIGNSFIDWEPGDKVILNGGTGSGKSSFTMEELSVVAGIIQERVLVLCNRTSLKEQTRRLAETKVHSTDREYIDIMSYQEVEGAFRYDPEAGQRLLDQYGYIVADECHYFWADAPQNSYTELLYNALLQWESGIIMYCSATAEAFFDWLVETGKVKKKHVYYIPADYSYVEDVTFYEEKQLCPLIDQILEMEEDTKIVVFVATTDRMDAMHKIYGESASYVCSQYTKNWSMLKYCDWNCIQNETFEKRLLFATSAIDNGVNLKDRKIRHIFTELYNIDSIRQSLGRKRTIADDGIEEMDTCKFYIRIQRNQDVNRRANIIRGHLRVVNQFRDDYEQFIKDYKGDRDIIKKNPIFYTDIETDSTKINCMKELRERLDLKSYLKIIGMGFENYVMEYLGEQLANKCVRTSISSTTMSDSLIHHLKTIEGKKLYSEEQEELKERFREDMAAHNGKSKRCGMKDMNTWIVEKYGNKYQKHFINKNPETNRPLRDRRRVLEDGTTNPHRNDGYWLLC